MEPDRACCSYSRTCETSLTFFSLSLFLSFSLSLALSLSLSLSLSTLRAAALRDNQVRDGDLLNVVVVEADVGANGGAGHVEED